MSQLRDEHNGDLPTNLTHLPLVNFPGVQLQEQNHSQSEEGLDLIDWRDHDSSSSSFSHPPSSPYSFSSSSFSFSTTSHSSLPPSSSSPAMQSYEIDDLHFHKGGHQSFLTEPFSYLDLELPCVSDSDHDCHQHEPTGHCFVDNGAHTVSYPEEAERLAVQDERMSSNENWLLKFDNGSEFWDLEAKMGQVPQDMPEGLRYHAPQPDEQVPLPAAIRAVDRMFGHSHYLVEWTDGTTSRELELVLQLNAPYLLERWPNHAPQPVGQEVVRIPTAIKAKRQLVDQFEYLVNWQDAPESWVPEARIRELAPDMLEEWRALEPELWSNAEDGDTSVSLYIPERIMNREIRNGKPHYWVKWQGYDARDNTWEPCHRFAADVPELVQEYEERRQKKEKDKKTNKRKRED